MDSFAYPTIFQCCEILPKRIKFHVEKKQLLLKFECISEDEVEVPMSSKVSRFHCKQMNFHMQKVP